MKMMAKLVYESEAFVAGLVAIEMYDGAGAWLGPVSSVREKVAMNLVDPTESRPGVTVCPNPKMCSSTTPVEPGPGGGGGGGGGPPPQITETERCLVCVPGHGSPKSVRSFFTEHPGLPRHACSKSLVIAPVKLVAEQWSST